MNQACPDQTARLPLRGFSRFAFQLTERGRIKKMNCGSHQALKSTSNRGQIEYLVLTARSAGASLRYLGLWFGNLACRQISKFSTAVCAINVGAEFGHLAFD